MDISEKEAVTILDALSIAETEGQMTREGYELVKKIGHEFPELFEEICLDIINTDADTSTNIRK